MFEQVDSEIYLLINNEQQANPDIFVFHLLIYTLNVPCTPLYWEKRTHLKERNFFVSIWNHADDSSVLKK